MTRNGIVYNLSESPYILKCNGLTFYFSSSNHREKFIETYKENRRKTQVSLSKRFNIEFWVDSLADIQLYSKIESRGFLIKHGEVEHECLKALVLNGEIKTSKL